MNFLYSLLRKQPLRRGPKRLVGGICSGVAARFGWDPWLVRLIVLISFLLPVVGFGTYVIAWLLLPWQDGSIALQRLLDALFNRAPRNPRP